MNLSQHGQDVLRELAKRRPAEIEIDRTAPIKMAAELREFFYPKQRRLFAPQTISELHGQVIAKWRATTKNRRSGATAGGVRELIARALEQPGFRSTYATTTRVEAYERAWKNDTKSGLVDVIKRYGTSVKHPSLECYEMGGVTIDIREGDLELVFSNGSNIELFGADNIRRHRVKRGNAKHVFWIDEAQDFPFLEEFFDGVVLAMQDFEVEVWVTGTPGKDCVGMFWDITKDEEDGETRAPGWEVHAIASTDNPFFGRVVRETSGYYVVDNTGTRTGPYDDADQAEAAAVEVRWDRTAGAAMRKKNWKGDEPDFVREQLGKWVRIDARYVYPVHAVPRHVLIYAPQRIAPNPFVGTHPRFAEHPPWYDHHAAVRDLPRARRGFPQHQWLYGLWLDFGYHPDPFAIVIGAFTPDLPDVYEMFSWKCTKVHTDDQGQYIKLAWDTIDSIVSFVGDPAGKQDDFEVWRERMNLPIEEANKKGKNTLEEFLADDIRRGRVHFREGSPVLTEMRHLVYLPGKPGKPREVHKHRKVNGVVHGDHNCFVAGTMVSTPSGQIPIESMQAGDVVMTRAGGRRIRDVLSVGEREVWRLTCDDGRILDGTADHPIWTNRGWIELAALIPGDTVTTWESMDRARLLCSTAGAIEDIQSLVIGRRASTLCEPSRVVESRGQNHSIERSGSMQTGQFQMGLTSITPTRIPSTTTSQTSFSGTAPSTCESTQAHRSALPSRRPISMSPGSTPRSGTDPLRGSLGMLNTVEPPWQAEHCSPQSVNVAELSSKRSGFEPRRAATSVEPRFDERAERTTKIERVQSAGWSTGSIGTSGRSVAPIRVLRVEPLARHERVYNLTVDGVPEFFANGILVHNCDAFRYGYADLTHYLAKIPKDKPAPGTREAYQAEADFEEKQIDDRERLRAQALAEGDEAMMEYGGYQWQ